MSHISKAGGISRRRGDVLDSKDCMYREILWPLGVAELKGACGVSVQTGEAVKER